VRFGPVRLRGGRIFQRYTQPQRVGEEIVGRVWSLRDITQPYRLEEELHHAQKMEAVGRLAGGVAHDFNNLLMLISGYANQILEDQAFSGKHRDSMGQLLHATQRASALTRQLLAFTRKQPVAPELVDLNHIVVGMQKILQRLASDRVTLFMHLHPDVLTIQADPSQIELMIMNLAINSRDAMPEGGILTIRTAAEALGDSKGAAATESPGFALLEVTDTGIGMAPEIQRHIFEPFFTTKDFGKGTGLGLSTVHGIVEQAGGYINVESQPNHGSSFRIYLPRAGTGVAEKQAVQELPPNMGN